MTTPPDTAATIAADDRAGRAIEAALDREANSVSNALDRQSSLTAPRWMWVMMLGMVGTAAMTMYNTATQNALSAAALEAIRSDVDDMKKDISAIEASIDRKDDKLMTMLQTVIDQMKRRR